MAREARSPDRGTRGMRRVYRATPRSVALARRDISAFVKQIGRDDPEAVNAISLAVSEACSNVVLHAYRDSVSPAEMVVVATQTEGGLNVEVIDHGVGLTPRFDSPGMGLGLPLMAQLSDEFEAMSSEGAGTQIYMLFKLRTKHSGVPAYDQQGPRRSLRQCA